MNPDEVLTLAHRLGYPLCLWRERPGDPRRQGYDPSALTVGVDEGAANWAGFCGNATDAELRGVHAALRKLEVEA